jgi:phytol kinase
VRPSGTERATEEPTAVTEAWIGFVLYLGYFVAAALAALAVRSWLAPPFEVMRKALHLIVTMSIFPLLHLFDTWYAAVGAAAALVLLAYPALALVEASPRFRRLAVERRGGEFKRSLVIVQLAFIALIVVFWGLLGPDARFIAVAAVMAWGFGDAAAALVGTSLGRRRIRHPWVKGKKTVEGTAAMLVVAGAALGLTLALYAGQPPASSFVVALLVAPLCAGVEVVSDGGTDTLTVPLSTSAAILSVLALVSAWGG